jgi:dihydroorotase
MEQVCRAAARYGLPLSPHCEDSPRAVSDYSRGVDPGFVPAEPYTNETGYVARDLALAARWGCAVHFSHLSLESSVRAVRRARAGAGSGLKVTFELTPHHLVLSAEDFPRQEAPKVNPPLRSRRDRRALTEALLKGEADAVASDHAPHTAEDKAEGASGLIGLETTLGVVLTRFVHTGHLAPLDAARVLSTGPARAFALSAGSLRSGAAGDATLIDPQLEWTVRGREFASLARNTPYEAWKLRGRALGTMVGGRLVFADDALCRRVKPVREAHP